MYVVKVVGPSEVSRGILFFVFELKLVDVGHVLRKKLESISWIFKLPLSLVLCFYFDTFQNRQIKRSQKKILYSFPMMMFNDDNKNKEITIVIQFQGLRPWICGFQIWPQRFGQEMGSLQVSEIE